MSPAYNVLHICGGCKSYAECQCLVCNTVLLADLDEDGQPCFRCPECSPEPHNCLEHMEYRQADSIEPHGEACRDEWWECSICHEKFTEQECERMMEAQNAE